MRRQLFTERPISRLAIWARRIALFSLAATLIAVILMRSGALEIVPALSTLAGALVLACLAILLAFGAGIVIWRHGVGGGRQAVTALLIGAALIAYPAYLGIKASRLPAIYDVTTDPIDPPQFDAIARLRPRDANPITYAGLYAAEQQHAAYPDIEPDETTASPQDAYAAAMKVITKRKSIRGKTDALYVVSDALIAANRTRIAALALSARVPTILSYGDYVEAGGLMYYGPNYADLFRRVADMVDKILHGTKPSDIPIEQPTKFELVINLKVAKALGITIPSTVLARADEVIE